MLDVIFYGILLILLYPIAAAIVSLYTDNVRTVVIFSSLSYSINLIISGLILFVPFYTGIFYVDFITKIYLLLINSIFLAMSQYSGGYILHLHDTYFHPRYFFMLSNLFAFTLLFSVVVNNLGLVWVGIAASTAASALLVALEKKDTAFEATWRYIIVVSVGLALSLIAISLLFYITGSYYLNLVNIINANHILVQVTLILALTGFGSKFGLFPLSTWLPDVHGEAPAPVSAIFSAVLLPVALYGFIRVYNILYSIPDKYSASIVIYAGIISALLSSIMFLAQIRYKRLIAYSSMENMSIALIGVGLGYYGLIGAMIIILSHGFAKSSAFFSAGNIKIETNETRIDKASAIGIPSNVSYSFILATMAVTGAPPFGVFIGEFLILYLLIKSAYFIPAILLAIIMLISFLSMLYHSVSMVHNGKKTSKITPFMEFLPLGLVIVSIIPAVLWVMI